ncbi:MAG: LysM peptidoglycan-binding domain-containing protein [Lewinellaceae bacterium]|nr:LysM peptidoglycan-binding domain-containing protein [Lewinellaceae bacterium]
MNKTIRLLLVLLFVPVAGKLLAENYYLFADPSCVSRMEYGYAETPPGKEYVKYALALNSTETFVFEVGLEGQAPLQRNLPVGVIKCTSSQRSLFTAAFVEALNNRTHRLFVVSTAGADQYRIAPVNFADYYQTDGQSFHLQTTQYRLNYFLDGRSGSGDLSNADPRGQVFFLQTSPVGPCTAYQFRQQLSVSANAYLDITYLPGIGILEERSGSAQSNFSLRTINGQPYSAFLSQACQQVSPQMSSKTATATAIPGSYDQGPGAAPSAGRVHIVQRGETLAGIARQYNIPLNDLKARNPSINPSLIRPNMAIQLDDAPASGDTFAARSPIPAGYDQAPVAYAQSAPAMAVGGQVHTVRRGETLLSIANQYNITLADLRTWNPQLNSTLMREGDQLYVNSAGNAGAVPTSAFTTKSPDSYDMQPMGNKPRMHVMQAYETPYSVALQYGITVQDLYAWNNLPNNATIQPGTTLMVTSPIVEEGTVPRGPGQAAWITTTGSHIVAEGETVASLSRRFGYTEERFRMINSLAPGEEVRTNQLVFTTDCTSPAANAPADEASNNPASYDYSANQPAAANPNNQFYWRTPETWNANNTPNTMSAKSGVANTTTNPNAYYGPIPGAYNDNRPLYEPSTQWASQNTPAPTSYNAAPTPIGGNPNYNLQDAINRAVIPTGTVPAANNPYQGTYFTEPGSLGTVPDSYDTQTAPSSFRKVYTVREGETIKSIAQKNGMTEQRLRDLNQLSKNEVVLPFQRLYLN